MSTIALRKLGTDGPMVFPFALGCMGMSGVYGPTDEKESIATIHAALERGVTLLDTGDFYGMGRNELLLNKALADGRRERVFLSVKFGAMRGPDTTWVGFDARPAAIKNFLAYSLVRLGTDYIDIYRPSRLDSTVPIEDVIGTLADLEKAGYLRHIGLSEVGAETVRRANAVHPITDLQIEYSLVSRGPESKIFPALSALGVAVTAYGVLARGLLVGSKPAPKGDARAFFPRFKGDNGKANQRLVAVLAALAKERGVSPAQLAIAWVLHKGPSIIPTIGVRTRAQLDEALSALELQLAPADVARIEQAMPEAIGTRYDEHHLRELDSER
jgi:aryl-alcohol dehydrogenase-like predicted oxidoreductase